MVREWVELAIERIGPGWTRLIVGRAKISSIFSDQIFNSPTRPKNRTDRTK